MWSSVIVSPGLGPDTALSLLGDLERNVQTRPLIGFGRTLCQVWLAALDQIKSWPTSQTLYGPGQLTPYIIDTLQTNHSGPAPAGICMETSPLIFRPALVFRS